MGAGNRMAAILFLAVTWLSLCSACSVEDVAVYKVLVRFLWSEESFPKDYPSNRPKAQWSPVFGQSHNSSYRLYHIGDVARSTVRNFAQFGKLDSLIEEGEEEPKVYDQFSSPPVGLGTGDTENMVLLDGEHSQVSLISHMIPSPDWFIGVDSLDLCVDSLWVEEITLDLEPLDAGAASGLTFTAPRWETSPPEPVVKHRSRHPNHPAAGFYYPELRELPPIAKVDFIKIKEYTSKELNELARRDIITKLKQKEGDRDWYKRRSNHAITFIEREEESDDSREEITTNKYLEQLKWLEEDPVGTPAPNLPDNNVVVVTEAPIILTTKEPEFDSDLKNMDDVVLAVARGRKFGLGKHLPRHFRSRLHHAVNRIQPNDCLVSEWGEWTSCSVTCGFGSKFRYRSVLRQQKQGGRQCPPLTDREHCGNVNSCAHIDYFDW